MPVAVLGTAPDPSSGGVLPPLGKNWAVLGGVILGKPGTDGVDRTLESVQGWGSPKTTLSVAQNPRSDGGYPTEAFLTPRSVVLGGTLFSTTPATLAAAKDALIAAAAVNGTTLTVNQNGYPALSATVYRNDEVLFGDESDQWTTYSVQLIAPDPRKYGPTTVESTSLPSQSGGATWPAKWPRVWSASVVSGVISLTNPGNASAPVILRVDGPIAGPIITHVSSGSQLSFASSLTLAAGEWLDIDLTSRSVLANGQARRDGYVLPGSGWFALDPGPNTIAFQAQTYSAGALLTVTAPSGAWM